MRGGGRLQGLVGTGLKEVQAGSEPLERKRPTTTPSTPCFSFSRPGTEPKPSLQAARAPVHGAKGCRASLLGPLSILLPPAAVEHLAASCLPTRRFPPHFAARVLGSIRDPGRQGPQGSRRPSSCRRCGFIQHYLGPCYVPGTVSGSREYEINKTQSSPLRPSCTGQ